MNYIGNKLVNNMYASRIKDYIRHTEESTKKSLGKNVSDHITAYYNNCRKLPVRSSEGML